jgi:hypothetical protein
MPRIDEREPGERHLQATDLRVAFDRRRERDIEFILAVLDDVAIGEQCSAFSRAIEDPADLRTAVPLPFRDSYAGPNFAPTSSGIQGDAVAQPCQGWGRGFESLRPLQFL